MFGTLKDLNGRSRCSQRDFKKFEAALNRFFPTILLDHCIRTVLLNLISM